MQELRLVGVHEDGEHLLLVGPGGEHYTVRLDEPLRAAARRDRPHLGQNRAEVEGGMRPREVQALVRAGATTEEIAERAGWSVEKVRKYEGPILAERAHVAEQARRVRVRSRGGPSGSGAPTLQARVGQRMRERGVDPATNAWDAWRGEGERLWTVVLTFAAGGRQRQAWWTFDVVLGMVEAADDEARWLSADEPVSSGSEPSAAIRVSSVYDVEAEGGVAATVRHGTPPVPTEEPLDLMTAMRQRTTVGRRGNRRRGGSTEPSRRVTDEDAGAAALPLDQPLAAQEPAAQEPAAQEPAAQEPAAQEPAAQDPAAQDPAAADPAAADALHEQSEDATPQETSTDEATQETEEAPAKAAARARRPRTSVPSWDDIMFGARRD